MSKDNIFTVQNWLHNRATVEYTGLREQLNNPGLYSIEFDGFRPHLATRPLGLGLDKGHWMKPEFATYFIASCARSTRDRGRFGINFVCQRPLGQSFAAALQAGTV